MPRSRCCVACLCLLLALAGCNVSFSSFTVPLQVRAGSVFEVAVVGGAGTQSGAIGAILQLPNGFRVVDAVGSGRGSSSILLQLQPGTTAPHQVTPEPGHHVATFQGSAVLGLSTPASANLKVYVRAPATLGAFTLKVVVWGTNGVLPAGTTSFAQITTAPHARSLTVVDVPGAALEPAPFAFVGTPPSGGEGLALGDVDGDGLHDLACHSGAYQQPLQPHVWRQGPGQWTGGGIPAGASGTRHQRIVFGDFDGDGHEDLADSSGRVLFGDGGTSWSPGPTLPLLVPEWAGVAVADIDGDGRDDVAFSAWTTDAVQVFRSGAGRTFTDWSGTLPSGTNGPAGADRLWLADVSGDGRVDIVATGRIGARAWLGDGTGTWQPAAAGLPSLNPTPFAADATALGDVDGDGRADLVVARPQAPLGVWSFVQGAWVQRPGGASIGIHATAVAVLDFDRDGLGDAVVAEGPYGGGRVRALRCTGASGFAPPQDLTLPMELFGVLDFAVGDLDGDRWPDLAASLVDLPPTAWINTGSGLSAYGSPCGVPGAAPPRTVGIGQPTLGNPTFAIGLEHAQPNGGALLWIGLDDRFVFGQPLLPYELGRLGAPGCSIHASIEAPSFRIADAGGRASLPLPIPNAAALRGVVLFAQAAAANPGANGLGWLFGNGLAVKIP